MLKKMKWKSIELIHIYYIDATLWSDNVGIFSRLILWQYYIKKVIFNFLMFNITASHRPKVAKILFNLFSRFEFICNIILNKLLHEFKRIFFNKKIPLWIKSLIEIYVWKFRILSLLSSYLYSFINFYFYFFYLTIVRMWSFSPSNHLFILMLITFPKSSHFSSLPLWIIFYFK